MRPSKNPRLIEAFAFELKARRMKLGLSQEALASKCDIDRPYITLIEGARKQPTLSVMWRLAGGLDCNLSELMRHVERRFKKEEQLRAAAAKAAPAQVEHSQLKKRF